jgi:hypothetical protein
MRMKDRSDGRDAGSRDQREDADGIAPGKRVLTESARPVQRAKVGNPPGSPGTPGKSMSELVPLSNDIQFADSIISGESVQRKAAAGANDTDVHTHAEHGTSGASSALPFMDQIQRSFGGHDISGIKAHSDSAAAEGARGMGATAFATGDRVAFATAPDLHTAAHEAAHVVQQRSGVQLYGGVGEVGDRYEQNADEVADAVVRGESAEGLLGPVLGAPSATGTPVQKKSPHTNSENVELVSNLLDAVDIAARNGLQQLELGDHDAAVEKANQVGARLEHLLSITHVPGIHADLSSSSIRKRAATALGRAQQLANDLAKSSPAATARIETNLFDIRADLSDSAHWKWVAIDGDDKKPAGGGFDREEQRDIITETLDVIEKRIAAVSSTSEQQPLKVTFSAVLEDLGHATREAVLASTDEKTRKKLAKKVGLFQKKLHAFRDHLAGAKDVWASLHVDQMQKAETGLLRSVGLPENSVDWDLGAANAHRAETNLVKIRERRERGEDVKDSEQLKAQNEAVSAADAALGGSKGSTGSQIASIESRILSQIETIENGRRDGYQDAVFDLAQKGMDSEPDYTSFGIALAGNLLWALSGVLPAAPIGIALSQGLRAAFAAGFQKPGPGWTAAVGTVGAMMAQFSNGIPSGSTASQLKSATRDQLSAVNSVLCNAMRRDMYEYLAHAIAVSPPEKSTDAQQYAAELELSLQHALFGQVFTEGLNDGHLPDGSKLAKHAEHALLNRYVVAYGSIKGDKFVATQSFHGRAEVAGATELLGGAEQVQVGRYEMVYNQIKTAAQDMGCSVELDEAKVQRMVEAGEDWRVKVTSFSPWSVWGGSPSRWMNPFHTDEIVECEPGIGNEPYMTASDIDGIDEMEIRKKDLYSSTIGSKDLYALTRVRFLARGAKSRDEENRMIKLDMPSKFAIMYRIRP